MSKPRESIKFAQRYFKGNVNIIVEVGVGDASHALVMNSMLNPKQIYLVDPFRPPDDWPEEDKAYNINEGNRNKNKVKIICSKSENMILIPKESHLAISDAPNELDLVYIDAIHDYENVKRDIESWFPKIRIGGILCGHDFHNGEVERAVIKRFPNIRKSPFNPDGHSNAEGNDWWIVKRDNDIEKVAELMK